jgi:hypothetical protein
MGCNPAYAQLQGEGPHYRALPGLTWSKAQVMDGPRQRPQGAQRAAMVRRVRRMAQVEAAGWLAGR